MYSDLLLIIIMISMGGSVVLGGGVKRECVTMASKMSGLNVKSTHMN